MADWASARSLALSLPARGRKIRLTLTFSGFSNWDLLSA
jgi:hypothetical protein